MAKIKKPVRNASLDDAGGEGKTSQENLETRSFKEDSSARVESGQEARVEEKDLSKEEIKKLRERVEKTELDKSLQMQASSQAKSIKDLDNEKKIKKLLDLAKTKGIIYAVNVAKKMNDPYVLDVLHDTLAKEGYYKNFTQ